MDIIRERFEEYIPQRYDNENRLYFQWAKELKSAVVEQRSDRFFVLRCYDYIYLGGGTLGQRSIRSCITLEYRDIISEIMSWGFSRPPIC